MVRNCYGENVILVKLLPQPGQMAKLYNIIKERSNGQISIKRQYLSEQNYHAVAVNNYPLLLQIISRN